MPSILGALEVSHAIIIFSALLLGLPATSVNGQTISNESKLLAQCEFIYSYTAQVMQLRNNTGAAVNILRRSTMMTAANMMISAEEEKIPGWKIKIWTELRPSIKKKLESKNIDPVLEADKCDKEVMPMALKVRDQHLNLWGQDFDMLQQQLMTNLRATTGI